MGFNSAFKGLNTEVIAWNGPKRQDTNLSSKHPTPKVPPIFFNDPPIAAGNDVSRSLKFVNPRPRQLLSANTPMIPAGSDTRV